MPSKQAWDRLKLLGIKQYKENYEISDLYGYEISDLYGDEIGDSNDKTED